MELHLHALLLVTQYQLLIRILPMHALAMQAIRHLPYMELTIDVYQPATQHRQLMLQRRMLVFVKEAI